jgi:transposase
MVALSKHILYLVIVKTPTLTREQCYAIYDCGREETVDFILSLLTTIASMQEQLASHADKIEKLEARNRQLESQIGKDSHNSHKPPSSDGLKRVVKSNRTKSNKPSGGQNGHQGTTLAMVEAPDHVVTHAVAECTTCGGHLHRVMPHTIHRRQVFDIPPVRVEVTEHRAEEKECPRCGSKNAAPFPDGVTKATQYGTQLKTITLLLSHYQLVPSKRLREALQELFGCAVSEGTIYNWSRELHVSLQKTEETIKEQIRASKVIHADETGIYRDRKLHWLHVASTEKLTCYAMHPKRGRAAIDAIGILPGYQGTVIHDCWSPYFHYSFKHGICNAHILRELIFAHEEDNQAFAQELKTLLLRILKIVNRARDGLRPSISPATIRAYEQGYGHCLALGFRDNNRCEGTPNKRGRPKQTKTYNLLERLRLHRDDILAFMYDFEIPFTNNLGERDLRMFKVKQKISGTFRSLEGAETFCRVRGYISTARKNGVRLVDAVKNALEGNPFIPALNYAE